MKAEETLERLMEQYGNTILRMCYLYLRDYHLAEDATQDVFLKVMHSYDTFENKSSEKAWLTRITINVCKNILRNTWFRFPKCVFDHSLEHMEQRDFSDKIIEKSMITNAILNLNVKDREVLILYYYQELSIREIAILLGKKENTITQRLNRARQRLKKTLMEAEYNV